MPNSANTSSTANIVGSNVYILLAPLKLIFSFHEKKLAGYNADRDKVIFRSSRLLTMINQLNFTGNGFLIWYLVFVSIFTVVYVCKETIKLFYEWNSFWHTSIFFVLFTLVNLYHIKIYTNPFVPNRLMNGLCSVTSRTNLLGY